MSRRPVTLVAVALTAALAATLVAGCGTGLQAQTYKETGRRDGASADVGGRSGVAVQRLHVNAPTTGSTLAAGDTAFLTGGIVNNGSSADALIGATSDVATSADLYVDGKPVQQVALPAQGAAPQGWSLALTGLTREVHVATYISVTLQFQRAGQVTLQVPVDAGDNGLQDRTPEQDPYKEG